MKKFVAILVTMLFLALAGCVDTSPSGEDFTHVIETLTATSYTPIPLSTPDPFEKMIVDLINFELEKPEDPLSTTLDATYAVVDVNFNNETKDFPTIFEITVQCECARNGECCNGEHTFVLVTRAMKTITEREKGMGIPPSIPASIPTTVTELRVICYDHKSSLGIMHVPWSLMRDYLMGIITADQLGWNVQKKPAKEP